MMQLLWSWIMNDTDFDNYYFNNWLWQLIFQNNQMWSDWLKAKDVKNLAIELVLDLVSGKKLILIYIKDFWPLESICSFNATY